MQSVVERVINLLIYLLESSAPVTADQIRQTVPGYDQSSDEAFHRMFERDKDVLRKLGVPLDRKALDAWEIDFGYTIDPARYAIADPDLTEEEMAALSLASRMVRLGEGSAGLEGLRKLGGVERGAGLEPLGADLGPEAALLGDLFGAITQRRVVGFDYRGERRTLEPYGLAHRRGHWYLVGKAPKGERVYRVDRLTALDVDDPPGAFKPPRDFDVRGLMSREPWESGQDELVKATVRFDSDVAWWSARTLGLDPWKSGPLDVEVPVANRDAFMGWILSFGASAEVLSPKDLRAELKANVEATLNGIS